MTTGYVGEPGYPASEKLMGQGDHAIIFGPMKVSIFSGFIKLKLRKMVVIFHYEPDKVGCVPPMVI